MKSTDKHPWAQNDSRAAFVWAESLTGEVPCRPPSEEAVEAEVVVTALHWSRRSNHHRVSAIRSTSESRPPPPFHWGTGTYYSISSTCRLLHSFMAINSERDQFHIPYKWVSWQQGTSVFPTPYSSSATGAVQSICLVLWWVDFDRNLLQQQTFRLWAAWQVDNFMHT